MFKKPNRRVLALIAAASLWVLIGASIAVAQGRFNDVPTDHTFHKEIEWMAANDITRGCNPAQGNTHYCPDRTLTRGEMSAFLYRLVNNLETVAGPQGPTGPTGPAGPQGPAGPAGFASVTVRTDVVQDGSALTVHCQPGEIAVGGGGTTSNSGNAVRVSLPEPSQNGVTPTGWTVRFDSPTGDQTAYVLCATVSP